MEGFEGNSSSSGGKKAPKLKCLEGNVTPLNLDAKNFIGRGISHQHHHGQMIPVFEPYASSDSSSLTPNLDSSLIKYLHWSSGSESRPSIGLGRGFLSPLPLASIENFRTPPSRSPPVKNDDDLLVMDGVLVSSKKSNSFKGGIGLKPKPSVSPTLTDTGGKSSSSGSENSLYKMEICWFWEDSGSCRFGSKCNFAHGKEELRTSFRRSKKKVEVKEALSPVELAPAAKLSPTTATAMSPIKLENTISSSTTTPALSSTEWHPLVDGIALALPCSIAQTLSKKGADNLIFTTLYGPIARKRLPVFSEFCPE